MTTATTTHVPRWLAACAVLDPNERAPRRAVRADYEQWCSREDETPLDARAFAAELRRHGVVDGGTVRREGKPVDAWRGIALDGVVSSDDVVSSEVTTSDLTTTKVQAPVVTTLPDRQPGEDDDDETPVDRPSLAELVASVPADIAARDLETYETKLAALEGIAVFAAHCKRYDLLDALRRCSFGELAKAVEQLQAIAPAVNAALAGAAELSAEELSGGEVIP